MDEKQILWNLYQESLKKEEYHHSQRTIVANIIYTIASAIIGLIAFDKSIGRSDMPLMFMLVLLGLYGGVFSLKESQLFFRHKGYSVRYRILVLELLPEPLPEKIRKKDKEASAVGGGRIPLVDRIQAQYLWASLQFVISLMGICLLLMAWLWPTQNAE